MEKKIEKDDLNEISKSGGLIEFVRQKHKKDGPVVDFYLGKNNQIVSINDLDLIKQTKKFGSRPKELFQFLTPLIGEDNLQIFSAERAAKFRKLTSCCLGQQIINYKYYTILNIANETLIDVWTKECKEIKSIYLQKDLLRFGLSAMIYTIFSTDAIEINLNDFKNAYDCALGGLFDRQMNVINSKKEQEIRNSIDYLKRTFEMLIDKRRKIFQTENSFENTDLFDILLTSNDPDTGKPFTNQMIISHLSGYLIAGYHTTPIATTWTLFALTQYPDIFKKVQKEIVENIGEQPSLKDLEKLEYLNKVIKESLRVYTPGPFAARLIEDDLRLPNGYKLEKGVTLFYPLFLIHKNEKYWSEPEKFNPERFDNDTYPNSFCAFGYGPRVCPGEKLAKIEIQMLIALIIQKFNFELDMNLNDVVPDEKFVVMAKNDIKIKLKSRFN